MPTDYDSIREVNQLRYGTDIGRIGKLLLAGLYDQRAHFIFELLQNAEDAIARRRGWEGSREVRFELSPTELRVSHCGAPFDARDVEGVCGIAEGTKDAEPYDDLTAIGHFGIGFKSVYAFTQQPRVHSGDEDFVIENYVWPRAAVPMVRDPDETTFVLPLDPDDEGASREIARGLETLGPRSLLFLREIQSVAWCLPNGSTGHHLRQELEAPSANARRVAVQSEAAGQTQADETWLVFARQVRDATGRSAGAVQVAFQSSGSAIQRLDDAPLVVYFPTAVRTNLGFLMHGPFRTTPSRDNVPLHDSWNQQLVEETGDVLVAALRELRQLGLLDVTALSCLPIARARFSPYDSLLAPLFSRVARTLRQDALIPTANGDHAPAESVMIARTREIRELFDDSSRLASLLGAEESQLYWITGELTQDRSPELFEYLTKDLDIVEVTPELVLRRLTPDFLEQQEDEWMCRLYGFLGGQAALLRQGRMKDIPLVRLADGRHTVAVLDGELQAFLPSERETEFPTVREDACASVEARAFLESLGLGEPDPVDDVIRNVLVRYAGGDERDQALYAADVQRIIEAFATDSTSKREKLVQALRETPFVRAINAATGATCMALPTQVYFATERFTALFSGVEGILLLDADLPVFRGESARTMLESAGVTRLLRLEPTSTRLSGTELTEIRRRATGSASAREPAVADKTIRGLDGLLRCLGELPAAEAAERARLLWESMGELVRRQGVGSLSGTHTWYYRRPRRFEFEADYVWRLNCTPWLPGDDGALVLPASVIFDTLGWESNAQLQSRIRFKPAVLEQLAHEAGMEAGVIELLQQLGVTKEDDLRERLGLEPGPEAAEAQGAAPSAPPQEFIAQASGGAASRPAENWNAEDSASEESEGSSDSVDGGKSHSRLGPEFLHDAAEDEESLSHGGRDESVSSSSKRDGRAREFISYIAVRGDEEERDPDGLDQQARLRLEQQAIAFIIALEPRWQRTPANHPGYDLFELSEDGNLARVCEVKAMSCTLTDRPATMSRTQFECAQELGDSYWLYVVECAGGVKPRIVPIRDPAGKARTFTFDRGWLQYAELD